MDQGWYTDSGASNHVTSEYNNIVNPTDYGGKEKVVVGNDNKLAISHIGNSNIDT